MEDLRAKPDSKKFQWSNVVMTIEILVIVILIGFIASPLFIKPRAASILPEKTVVTQSEFEKQTGMRVTLIAVTAAGGMVDFRFKVVDVDKAKQILQEKQLLPYLSVPGSNKSLNPDSATLQDIRLEKDLVYYVLYSNSGNLVEPGNPVSVIIGDWQLEPIVAK